MNPIRNLDNKHEPVTAADSRVTWPLLVLSASALMIGVFNAAHKFAANEQMLFAAVILVAGTLLAAFSLGWNWLATLRADNQRLNSKIGMLERRENGRDSKRMMATMGHEIRTPLNGVIGMLDLLLDTSLTAEQQNYASIARGSGRTLLSILDEMLDRAKSENNDDRAPVTVELATVIENVTELLAPRAHSKGIEISSCIAADVPAVLPFRDLHMRQILFNLAGNAIKFTESGGVSIRASIVNNAVEIEIRDTGIGLTAKEQSRLFAAFAQANDQTQRRYGGSGLGLMISKQLVEALGGRLLLDSVVGRGTTFTMVLPTQALQRPEALQHLSGRHYVVAMPDTMLRHDLIKNLEAQGATASAIALEDADLTAALAGTATAVICDSPSAVKLRRMAEARKRQKKTLPQLWIVLNPEERRSLGSLLSAPTTGYLVKPVRRSTLVKQLTERDSEHVAAQTSVLRQVNSAARKPRKLRLLLVEDTPVNALLAKTLLTKAGHETRLATSGKTALDLLAADRNFDAILMDVEMPDINGLDATRILRDHERDQNLAPLPVLALTANVQSEDIAACLAAGMDGHLAKPFDRSDLEDALRKLISRQAA